MQISESAVLTPRKGGALIQLITPGVGSSGEYPAAVLEAAARDAVFPAGTLMFADHPTPAEEGERPERSIRDVAGVLTENARWDGTALVAEARLYGPWKDIIAEMADAIGVSIRATAEVAPAQEAGAPVVIGRLVEGLSVDFVTYPGRGGAIREIYESAPGPRVTQELPSDPAGTVNETHEKESPMGTIQIDEAEHQRLTDRAGQVESIEAARDEAIAERDALRAQITEAHRTADTDYMNSLIGGEFTALEADGLRARATWGEDGRLDRDAFTKTVEATRTEAANRNQEGRPTHVGATESKDMSDADLDIALGITRKDA